MKNWRLGIDIGGTFTDVIAHNNENGETRSAKVPSNKSDQIESLVSAIHAVGLDWDEVADLTHGTTVVTNDIVEDLVDDVALVTTAGFGDTIAIGRGHRRQLYYLDQPPKLPPLVPSKLRFEVKERMDREGNVVVALTDEEIQRVVSDVKQSGVCAVAVCLIHAYKNGEHERLLAQALSEVVAHVCLSHVISPEIREYERTNTTVLSASVIRRVSSYLDRIDTQRPSDSNLHFFHSSGGMAAPTVVARHPLQLAMSGPAAGISAAVDIMQSLDVDQALTFDMGGTTTDTCLIVDGKQEVTSDQELGDRRIRLPMVAVHSIGAGGGSIARMDNGVLMVGPRSAGAMPGPACYGLGGVEPTVSDANIVLGYLNPTRTLGGKIRLDRDAAATAINPLAEFADRTIEETALGILTVANSNMVRALNKVTVERGVDGRDCALIAYGGSGPIHATSVARQYGIRKVIIPAFSSGFSALGCMTARLSYSQQRTVNLKSNAWSPETLEMICDELHSALSEQMKISGLEPAECDRQLVAMVRYVGQSFDVPIEDAVLDSVERLQVQFYEKHHQLFGFHTEEPWELVAIRAALTESGEKFVPGDSSSTSENTQLGTRTCFFEREGAIETVVIDRESLTSGSDLVGPAVIEDEWSTTVLSIGDTARIDEVGHIFVDVGVAQ